MLKFLNSDNEAYVFHHFHSVLMSLIVFVNIILQFLYFQLLISDSLLCIRTERVKNKFFTLSVLGRMKKKSNKRQVKCILYS